MFFFPAWFNFRGRFVRLYTFGNCFTFCNLQFVRQDYLVFLYRPGVYNGAVGVGKIDGISQPTGLSVRSMTPRADLENNSLLNDRRERPHGSDKERVNIRSVNKYALHP